MVLLQTVTLLKILALDISGKCTGWAFGEEKLLAWGKHIQKQNDSKSKKLADFANWITDLLQAKKPDIILIEKPYRGRNSNVLVSISRFIAIAELCAFVTLSLELEPEWFLDPRTVKKTLKVSKGKDYEDNKKLMVQKINKLYGLHLKYGIKKSKKFNDDDSADAIALLTAWWEINGYK